jgi:hypothetical protein
MFRSDKILEKNSGLISYAKKYKSEIILFVICVAFYLTVTLIFFKETTIFYELNNNYDVVLDTDTGVLINWNTFVTSTDNGKHFLFSAIVSIFCYPAYELSLWMSNIGLFDFKTIYGFSLIFVQILISSTSIVMVFNHIRKLKLQRITTVLIMSIMMVSFPQMLMTINVERFIYAQLSLVLFMMLSEKFKDKDSYIVDIAAIPLLGITITNVYLYLFDLILKYKFKVKKMLKHIGVFIFSAYIITVSTRSYESFFTLAQTAQSDTKFLASIPILEKLSMIVNRLLCPVLFFPAAKFDKGMLLQNGSVNKIYVILILLILCFCILTLLDNLDKKIVQLSFGVLITNIVLHGIIGYNLLNASIMTIQFSFAVIILLSYFTKSLKEKEKVVYNIFLGIVLLAIIISNIIGFKEIFEIGVKYYPFIR